LAYDGVDDNAQKTQSELYLDEAKYIDNRGSATFDILSFWKGNEFRYPEVATMARDILSIPIFIVAS
jgi:biotin synthase-like enzyme